MFWFASHDSRKWSNLIIMFICCWVDQLKPHPTQNTHSYNHFFFKKSHVCPLSVVACFIVMEIEYYYLKSSNSKGPLLWSDNTESNICKHPYLQTFDLPRSWFSQKICLDGKMQNKIKKPFKTIGMLFTCQSGFLGKAGTVPSSDGDSLC